LRPAVQNAQLAAQPPPHAHGRQTVRMPPLPRHVHHFRRARAPHALQAHAGTAPQVPRLRLRFGGAEQAQAPHEQPLWPAALPRKESRLI